MKNIYSEERYYLFVMAVFGVFLVIFAASLHPGEFRSIDEPIFAKWEVSQETLTADVCSDCHQIMELATKMILSNKSREVILDILKDLCRQLPVVKYGDCRSRVKEHLPQILPYTSGHPTPGEACKALGLCAGNSDELVVRPLPVVPVPDVSPSASDTATGTQAQIGPQCTLCLFLIKKMEDLLPKNRTEEAVVKLMGDVCSFLPHRYKEKCNDFINKHGKQIVDFLLLSAAPYSICAVLQLCLLEDTSHVGLKMALASPEMQPRPLRCESCHDLAVLSRLHLGLNATQTQTATFLRSVCHQHPNTIPQCEVFMKLFGFRLQAVLGNHLDIANPCERAELCVSMEDLKTTDGRCGLGASYWCKEMKTALKCGNVAFCEKYMWK